MANIAMLKAKGLYTHANFLSSIPEGSLLDATNVNIDRDGIIEPRRGIFEYGEFGILADRAKQLLNYKDRVLVHYGTTLAYDDGTGNVTDFTGTFTEVLAGLRIKGVELNGNFYVTTSSGIKKIASATSTLSGALVSDAGGVKALDVTGTVNYSTAGFLTGLSKVAYRVVWGINDVNENLILGSPSSRLVVTNYDTNSGTVDLNFAIPNEITSTDYFYQVYRTTIATAPSLNDLDDIDPGDEMRLVYEANVTSTELASGEVNVNDITPEDFQQGGALLYTNPVSGDGILQANDKPPVAHDIAIFKNSIFYANTRTRHRMDLSLLGIGNLEKLPITGASVSLLVLTLVSTAHGLVNGQKIAVVIPNSNATFGTSAVDVSTNTITLASNGFNNGQPIQFSSTVTLPAGLLANTTYYVINVATNTFQVSTTFNGSAVDITTQGTGTHSVVGFTVNNEYTVANATANTIDITIHDNAVIGGLDNAYIYTSYLTVTDGSTTNRYFFVGVPEVTRVVLDGQAATADGSYFLINSAENSVKYFIWFDKTGTTLTPSAADTAGRVGIRVDISAAVSPTDVADAVKAAVEAANSDFVIDQTTNTLDFITANNGRAGTAEFPSGVVGLTAPGGAFSITVTHQGYGEDVIKKFVRWSGFISQAQAVDDTARSLINVINRNDLEIIYGYYLSGPDDVPGIMNFESRVLNDTIFSIVANNSSIGSLFSPDLTTAAESSDEEAANRLYFSKYQQPEAVPIVNFLDIGPKDKAILRIVPLRDSLFIFKEDGIYRLTGEISPNFSVTLFDNSVELLAPDSAAVLNNQIYCLTDGGVATVTETGVGIISRPIENVFNRISTNIFTNFSTASFGIGYETDRAYFVWTVTNQTDTVATQCFRYNTFTQSWTRWDKPQTCVVLNSDDGKLYFGSTDSNFIEVERKSLTRRDYADREFDLSIGNNAVVDNMTIRLSSVIDAEEGDAIVQTQYVTTDHFNLLLLKLDADPRIGLSPGTFDTDYAATLTMVDGDNLTNKMLALVTKLNADPGTDGGYVFSGATAFATIQTEYNTMITSMNSDLKLKFNNYRTSTGTSDIEMTIESVDINRSTVSGEFVPFFMVGPIVLFKGIQASVVWAPVNLGDPSLLKHVRESTMLFESSDFRGGDVAYNTDLSPSFESIHFSMDGNGTWGGFVWGENTWGGGGTSVPFRTYIPRQKQRCRYIRCRFLHDDAFYKFSILGVSYTFEVNSERAYRGKE